MNNIETLHLLIFTIPGFFIVWSFTKYRKVKIESDFEYLVFSFFWGIVMLALLGNYMETEKFKDLFKNIYSLTLVLSLFGCIFGLITSFVYTEIVLDIKILIKKINAKSKK